MKLTGNTQVLVIDDDKNVLTQAEKVLKTLSVKLVLCCSDAEEARALIDQTAYNVIIVDLRMPTVSGSGIIQLIRNHKNPKIANTPILALYGVLSNEETELLSEFDMVLPVKKPFIDEDLASAVLQVLRSTEVHSASEFCDNIDHIQFGRMLSESINAEKLEHAKKLLAPKLTKQPESCRLNTYLAAILFAERQYDKASALLDKIFKINHDFLPALTLKSKILCVKRDFEGALSFMERAQLASPLNTQRLIAMGNIHLSANRYGAAEDKFQRALAVIPGLEDAKIGLGQVHIARGHVDKGLELLAELENPTNIVSYLNFRGAMLAKGGQQDAAIILYNRAIQCSIDSWTIYALEYNIGLAYSRKGDYSNAKIHLEKSLMLKPDFIKAMSLLNKISKSSVSHDDFMDNLDISFKLPETKEIELTEKQLNLLIGATHAGFTPDEKETVVSYAKQYNLEGKLENTVGLK